MAGWSVGGGGACRRQLQSLRESGPTLGMGTSRPWLPFAEAAEADGRVEGEQEKKARRYENKYNPALPRIGASACWPDDS